MLYFYQHIPEHISPIVFSIGTFNIRWYSVMYLAGFLIVYCLLNWRIKKKETEIPNSLILDFLIYAFIGLLIGARLGYVIFYDFDYFFHNPLAIISPFSGGRFTGIFGMSYHGGLIGVIISSLIFIRKNKINPRTNTKNFPARTDNRNIGVGVNFWNWADFIIPAIPAGFFFGRLGNFLNGELYGRPTEFFWGMYFSSDRLGLLRHPSQLYEAFFEGLALFLILWSLRNKSKFPGYLLVVYLFGYGFFRFLIEFVREADAGLIFGLTRGQVLSLGMIVAAVIVFLRLKIESSN
ncbi:MAG: prolipoprotein diacylglyceryl transferase [bacterium]|nr:prolipoprotein diacylglyceryl transferase [bacterium]